MSTDVAFGRAKKKTYKYLGAPTRCSECCGVASAVFQASFKRVGCCARARAVAKITKNYLILA
eukprot:1186577-Prorocentrum_minimum.AAC.5